MTRGFLNLLSAAVALACLVCVGLSVRSVRYVGGRYLPTHNREFALLAALLLILFLLVRARARKLKREDRLGLPATPRKVDGPGPDSTY
jgi:hypothetical protein